QTSYSVLPNLHTDIGLSYIHYDNTNIDFQKTTHEQYQIIDPSVLVKFKPHDHLYYKLGWNKAHQNIHNIALSNTSLPVDFWIAGTEDIDPSKMEQITFGAFYERKQKNQIEGYIEFFNRKFKNIYEFN